LRNITGKKSCNRKDHREEREKEGENLFKDIYSPCYLLTIHLNTESIREKTFKTFYFIFKLAYINNMRGFHSGNSIHAKSVF
jgi:hypothetical protein